jgi:hypothetical protein
MSIGQAFLLTIIASFCGLWLTISLVSVLKWPDTKGERDEGGQSVLTMADQDNFESPAIDSLPAE